MPDPRERRIEVRLDVAAYEHEHWAVVDCGECGQDAGGYITVTVTGSFRGLMEAAERRGLDPMREFRMRYHRAFGYVEFWQVPTPVPSVSAPVKAAS